MSAVGFAAVTNSMNLNCVVWFLSKTDAVVTDAQTQFV